MLAVGVALLSGSVLACPPGSKKTGSSASFASVTPDNVKTDRVKSKTSKFRSLVLDQFDTNQNGRLDSKERAAANRALSGKGGDAAVQALRKQALLEFDANGNGKLDKPEIHKALSSVNAAAKQFASNESSNARSTSDEHAAISFGCGTPVSDSAARTRASRRMVSLLLARGCSGGRRSTNAR